MKRILQELKEIQKDDNPDILAEALEVSLIKKTPISKPGFNKFLFSNSELVRVTPGQHLRMAFRYPWCMGH